MDFNEAQQLAQQLLDSEFEGFSNKPLDYCLSMGWSKTSPSTIKAVKYATEITFTAQDVQNLTSIILSCETDEILDITERGSVSDFLCNCIAGHIIDFK